MSYFPPFFILLFAIFHDILVACVNHRNTCVSLLIVLVSCIEMSSMVFPQHRAVSEYSECRLCREYGFMVCNHTVQSLPLLPDSAAREKEREWWSSELKSG